MKISKIAALCKREKTIVIWDDPKRNGQWLGTSNAMYLLDGAPRLTPEECLRLFDVPQKKRIEYRLEHLEALPEGFDLSDGHEGNPYDPAPMITKLIVGGETFQGFKYYDAVLFINNTHMTPFGADTLNMYSYRNGLLGISLGLCLQAVILPYHFSLLADTVVEELRDMQTTIFLKK